MRKSIFRTTLLAAALGCTSIAFAATPQATTSGSSGSTAAKSGQAAQHRPNLFDELGLSDSQRSSVRQLLQQNMQQARPQLQSLRQKQMAFENATPGTSAYKSATDDLAQAESTAAREQVMRQADLRTKVYNLLTPDQRTKLASLRAQRNQQMAQRRQQMLQRQQQQSSNAQTSPKSSSR